MTKDMLLTLVGLALAMAVGFLLARFGAPRARARRERDFDFFAQIPDAALVTENGVIIDANAAAARQFGYDGSTLVGLPVTTLLANPEDEKRVLEALAHGPVTDLGLPLRTARGQILDCVVTATGRYDAKGRLLGCHGVARDVTERKRTEIALRRAEQDYRGLFEHAHDAILILDPELETVLDANEHACVLYGYSREDFIGRSMVELSVDPDRGRKLVHQTCAEGGRSASFDSLQLRRDGTPLALEVHAAEVSYKGRRVILTINRDVSARRNGERAIRESEERFRLLLESVTDYSIVMLDPRGLVVSWNEGAQRITGYAAEEVLGRSAALFSTGADAKTLAEDLAVAATTDRLEREMERVRKDGSRFTASVTLTRIVDDSGLLRGYAEITHDITLSQRLEEERQGLLRVLNGVATEWTTTFDAVHVPIVLLDEDGAIRRLNRAAMTLAGQPFQHLIHHHIDTLPGEPWHTIGRLGRAAFGWGGADATRATKGDAVWQVSASLNGDASNPRAIVVAYDLTLLTQLETSLRRNEVAAALGSLVAGVAHEVRNPLFTISATLDAWEACYGGSAGLARYAGSLREQIDRLNRLMRDLLEYGKPHSLNFRQTSIAEVVRAAAGNCAVVARQQDVSVVLAVDPDLPPISIDPERMEQVFLNLIDNAIRHTPAGGVVRVEAVNGDGGIVCHVLDEGPGLAAEDLANVFVPMYTRRRGGTGLGLPIARNIVIAHRGEITLNNREQVRGAVATVVLPGAPARADSETTAACA